MSVVQNNWCETDWCRYEWTVPTGYDAVHTQVTIVTPGAHAVGVQIEIVAYNIQMLRILWEIKSDGITANNFTASSEASVDKGVVNLKSDIVEKYWQSTGTTEWVQWDAGSGKTISLDTFALIQNNLSSTAVVRLKGYGSSASSAPVSWAGVAVFATLAMPDDPDETNLIWISPSIPANSFRHWRLEITDTLNPDGFVRAGRLAAGSALVFSGENCLDQVVSKDQNFKDEQKLNGFTTIANNRALKKYIKLSFRDLNTKSLANYRKLRRYYRYCRDTLKALMILDPRSESTKYEFAAFAKLRDTPSLQTQYVDDSNSFTTLDLEFDEGR